MARVDIATTWCVTSAPGASPALLVRTSHRARELRPARACLRAAVSGLERAVRLLADDAGAGLARHGARPRRAAQQYPLHVLRDHRWDELGRQRRAEHVRGRAVR